MEKMRLLLDRNLKNHIRKYHLKPIGRSDASLVRFLTDEACGNFTCSSITEPETSKLSSEIFSTTEMTIETSQSYVRESQATSQANLPAKVQTDLLLVPTQSILTTTQMSITSTKPYSDKQLTAGLFSTPISQILGTMMTADEGWKPIYIILFKVIYYYFIYNTFLI